MLVATVCGCIWGQQEAVGLSPGESEAGAPPGECDTYLPLGELGGAWAEQRSACMRDTSSRAWPSVGLGGSQ